MQLGISKHTDEKKKIYRQNFMIKWILKILQATYADLLAQLLRPWIATKILNYENNHFKNFFFFSNM